MDTQVLPNSNNPITPPQVLPREIETAIAKHDRREARTLAREGWGATTGGKSLTKAYLTAVSEAMQAALQAPLDSRDPLVSLILTLRQMDPDVLALCVMRSALHSLGWELNSMVEITKDVGRVLEGECWGAGFTKHNPRLAARVAKAVKARSNRSAKARDTLARKLAQKVDADYSQRDWGQAGRVRAGSWALKVMMDALPDVFEWRDEGDNKYLYLTDKAWGVVDAAIYTAVNSNPVFFPMTEPPIPWTRWDKCGPKDPRVGYATTFLRSRHQSTHAAVREAIASGQMQPALDGVNTLQSVAWKINTRVLDVIRECEARQVQVPGLPQWKDMGLPKRVEEDQWVLMDDGQKRLHWLKTDEIRKINRAAIGDRVRYMEDMNIATEMSEAEQFYVPMNCDWRGRVYGITHFNFQREDYVRALFLFKEGAPIGVDGLYWLKVHVANCGAFGKIDKRPIEERVKWVDDNLEHIRLIAERPLDTNVPYAINLVWMNADKPYLFLAAVMELASALSVGTDYVTHLPISFDGSCSGLQHLSAMTRAAEGALVNLTPNALPQDVYQTVAEVVNQRLEDDTFHEPENPQDEEQVKASDRIRALARLALAFGIGRGEVKRNVMTYAYSSKKFGMAVQLQKDLMAPLAREVLEGKYEEHPFAPYHTGDDEHPGPAARYLANHIFEAIETIVHKPSEAMKYLQKLARTLAHEAKPLRWTSPVGIPWINRYHDPRTKRVTLWLGGSTNVRARATVADGHETEINKDKAANGVAPNFVHALDAAHLLLVANAARSEGIASIATVHDSFGCLPSQAGRFRQIIVEQFLAMYEKHDVLTEVREQASCDLSQNNWHMLPDVIEFGSLNLKEILNADFAFA